MGRLVGDEAPAVSGRLEEALARHPDMTDRADDDGCGCGKEPNPGKYSAHLSATVLALLDSPETREVVAAAIHEYETAVGSLEDTALGAYAEVALAALREWLGAES